jgi:hypothetical protein
VASAHSAGGWRVGPASAQLPVSDGYVVAAYYSLLGDAIRVGGDGGLTNSTISEISYVRARVIGSASIAYPRNATTSPSIVPGYAGVTFSVPETTSASLLGLGLVAMGWIGRRSATRDGDSSQRN